MTTGEKIHPNPFPSYKDWSDATERLTGDVRVLTRDPKKLATIPLQNLTIPLSGELQDRFGANARIKVFGNSKSGYAYSIGAGPLRLTRHALLVEAPPDQDIDQPARLTLGVRQRMPFLSGFYEGIANCFDSPSSLAPDVPPRTITDPDEAATYLRLLESAAEFSVATGRDYPKDIL